MTKLKGVEIIKNNRKWRIKMGKMMQNSGKVGK